MFWCFRGWFWCFRSWFRCFWCRFWCFWSRLGCFWSRLRCFWGRFWCFWSRFRCISSRRRFIFWGIGLYFVGRFFWLWCCWFFVGWFVRFSCCGVSWLIIRCRWCIFGSCRSLMMGSFINRTMSFVCWRFVFVLHLWWLIFWRFILRRLIFWRFRCVVNILSRGRSVCHIVEFNIVMWFFTWIFIFYVISSCSRRCRSGRGVGSSCSSGSCSCGGVISCVLRVVWLVWSSWWLKLDCGLVWESWFDGYMWIWWNIAWWFPFSINWRFELDGIIWDNGCCFIF